MSQDHDTLGLLSEELAAALVAGEHVDAAAWATRFDVPESDVVACRRALEALDLCLGEEPDDGPPELPRPTLPADYEIEREIGRGGMGVVYRAIQRGLGRAVAVKVLRPGDLIFGDALRRFRAEARSLARLRHRHIVSVHDVGETAEGLVWYAMDLVEGRTLAEEVQDRSRLTPTRALKILRQITSAIAYAHSQGVVHRDLKPHNVLIDEQGDAFVVDFGLARDAAATSPRTLTGELLGTPAYMSPEQARGDHARIGEATDIWALGALLYECLTGHGPFAGKPLHETIRAILHDDPTPPRRIDARVPAALDAVCLKALRKRPQDRYATALALGGDLERFAAGRAVTARPPSRWEQAGRALLRNRSSLAAASISAVIAIVAFVVFVLPGLRSSATLAEARRALDAGYPGAAVESFSSMLDEFSGDTDTRIQMDLDFARALNDRAGELLATGDLEGAGRLAIEARRLCERRQLPLRSHNPFWVEGAERDAWRWEFTRATAIAPPDAAQSMSRAWSDALDVERLNRALSSPRPALVEPALRVARRFGMDPALAQLDEAPRIRVLVELHRQFAERFESGAFGPHEVAFPFEWDSEKIAAWWSPAAEDALAAMAVDANESELVRATAFRSWSAWTGLPIEVTFRGADDELGSDPAARAAAAPRTIAAWRTWQSMPRDAALRARIDFLVGLLTERDDLGLGARGAQRIAGAVMAIAGRPEAGESEGAIVEWWTGVRSTTSETWIREGLGLGLRPGADETITTESCLSNVATATVGPAILWRHLAWLRLPTGVRVPEAMRFDRRDWIDAWWRGAAVENPRQFVARIGVLAFANGRPEPSLVGEAQTAVAVGEGVRLEVAGNLPFPARPRVDHREVGSESRALAREQPDVLGDVLGRLDARLVVGAQGPMLLWDRRASLSLHAPTDGGVNGHASAQDGVGLGRARATEQNYIWGGRSDDLWTVLLVVRVDEVGALPTDDSLDAWRAAIVRSLEDAAVDPPRTGHLADILTPWLWSLPEAQDALVRLVGSFGYASPLAATLAGAAPSQTVGELPNWVVPSAMWTRIAVGSPSPASRQWAADQLAKTAITLPIPGIAETLLAGAADGNVVLDESLAQRARAAASARRYPWLRIELLVGALAMLSAAVGLALSSPRFGPWPPRIAWVAANLLIVLRVEIGDVVILPQYAAFAIAALVATRVNTATRVARRVTATVYSLFACYSACAAWGVVEAMSAVTGQLWTACMLGCWFVLLRRTKPVRRR